LKGSQRHLQDLVNDHPEYLNYLVYSARPSLSKQALSMPSWVSPLKQDNYQEFYDEGFLAAIGQQRLESSLREFWPKNGPVWDALATIELKDSSHGLILLEAKSYSGELGGPSYTCGAKGLSRDKIVRSLDAVKSALGVQGDHDWLGEYYQFANRLAHLYFFNSITNVPAWLVYLHFVGDTVQGGPLTVTEWLEPISRLKDHLGLSPDHILSERIITVFAPVTRITLSV